MYREKTHSQEYPQNHWSSKGYKNQQGILQEHTAQSCHIPE